MQRAETVSKEQGRMASGFEGKSASDSNVSIFLGQQAKGSKAATVLKAGWRLGNKSGAGYFSLSKS